MCMSMVMSVGTTRSVGGPAKGLATVVAISSGVTPSVPMRLPSMDMRMKR